MGLRLVLPPGVTPETSNLAVPRSVYPRRDGLILRPVDAAAPGAGLEPTVAHWNLTPFFHKGPLKAWKASTNNARSETMAGRFSAPKADTGVGRDLQRPYAAIEPGEIADSPVRLRCRQIARSCSG